MRRVCLLTGVLLLIPKLYTSCMAQVIINANNSDSAAILEIRSFDKGLLIPRLNEAAIFDLSPTEGLLVFHADNQYFNYFENDSINILNPWQKPALEYENISLDNANIKVGIGTSEPASTIDINGSLKLKDFNVFPQAQNGTLVFSSGSLYIKTTEGWKKINTENVNTQNMQ